MLGWANLFAADLSNAEYPAGVWSFDDGVLTATEDQAIWTKKDYENFILDLEFKTAPRDQQRRDRLLLATSKNWIPNSVEIQIADDFAEQWAEGAKTWQCAAIFGHLAPDQERWSRSPASGTA